MSALERGAVAPVLVWLAACSVGPSPTGNDAAGLPLGDISPSFMQARAEGHLQYPGSIAIGKFESTYRSTDLKPRPAYVGLSMRSTDSPAQVNEWYRSWLLAHGWTGPYQEGATAVGTISADSYHRGSREGSTVAITLTTPSVTGFDFTYHVSPAPP